MVTCNMYFSYSSLCLMLLLGIAEFFTFVIASKRGLIGVNNVNSYGDQATLLQGSSLSWAMNYGVQPGNRTWFGQLEFVPQLWGWNDAASFEEQVLANVPLPKHILTFNEPDGSGSGQATMSPAQAASLWLKYIQPLKAHNMTLGSPACTGTDSGVQWLKEFYGNCTHCDIDFIATHWYGSFQGLAAHLGNLYNVFNGTKLWVTELGIADATIVDTEFMFNNSVKWLDGLSWVDRYAWFGSFRSTESNLGPNATFLDASGHLTPLGQIYLGNLTASQSTTTSSAASATSARASSAASHLVGCHTLRYIRLATLTFTVITYLAA